MFYHFFVYALLLLRAVLTRRGRRADGMTGLHAVLRPVVEKGIWVLPQDCHSCGLILGNDRYFQHLEMGRLVWCYDMSVVKLVFLKKYRVVAGGFQSTFLKALPMFSRYDRVTQLVGWNSRWLFFKQQMIDPKSGKVLFAALGKFAFVKGGKALSSQQFIEVMNWQGEKFEEVHLTPELEAWIESEARMLECVKRDAAERVGSRRSKSD